VQYVLGSEFAGRIAANSPIPRGCAFKPGDRVFGSAQGAFGERVAAQWRMLLPIPDVLSYDEAAGTTAACAREAGADGARRAVRHLAHEL
jgi:NADPH:quinone reductase-like Zn-dependent oxidoreductase